jgi:hypothetical protein
VPVDEDDGRIERPPWIVRGRRHVARWRVTARSDVNRARRAAAATFGPEPFTERLRVSGAWRGRDRAVTLPVDRVLVGGEAGIGARRLARAVGDPMRPSTRITEGALAALLSEYRATGAPALTDAAVLASEFGRELVAALHAGGHPLGARRREDLPGRLRGLVREARERPRERVRVRRVRDSDCFQVEETAPALVRALLERDPGVPATLRPGQAVTPLQDLLLRMSWLAGARRLYQPIDAPELEGSWELVRGCEDRLALMTDFLAGAGIRSPATYLDVASCYGWFVAAMRDAGYDATGVESDELAARCGSWVYGLPRDRVTVADAVPFLAPGAARHDVVSCFSLLHHLVLRGEREATGLIRALDDATGRVLFLDTGEHHEEWLRHLLPGWDPPFIGRWLRRHTTFRAVVPLGVDHDRRPPNGDNYGRTLFACLR